MNTQDAKELKELRELRDVLVRRWGNALPWDEHDWLCRDAVELRDKYAKPINLIQPRDE